MKININDFLLKAILEYWNAPTDLNDDEVEYTNFIFEPGNDYDEYLSIESISVEYFDDDDFCKFDVEFEYTVKDIRDDEIKVKYTVMMYYLLQMTPFPDSKIKAQVMKYYIRIRKDLSIYYPKYEYRSHNGKYLVDTYNFLIDNSRRYRSDALDLANADIYGKELSNLDCILGQYEKDIIENDKYGEYDSLLMENIFNIISDYNEDIYELCGKNFIIYLGKNEEESVYADIKVVYFDDPVDTEEEVLYGYFIDFEIEIMDKKYIMTYNVRTKTECEDCIYSVDRLLDNGRRESLYISTFNIEIHKLEDSLSERESELNYTVV